MITPRRITLHRAAGLHAFRSTLTHWITTLSPTQAYETCVVIPTHAAAEQLRRTVEAQALHEGRCALLWPMLATRRDLYAHLASWLRPQPVMLSAFEREVLLASAARATRADGLEPPYELRPGLIAEMLALYDRMRRLGRDIAHFERNFCLELEREQDTDRGAQRLLQQTLFLAAAYRRYEAARHACGRSDEHALRDALARTPLERPLTRIIVTVGDHVVDPDGFWPADYDLLARLPGLEHVDLLCTDMTLAGGALERLHGAFPELDEQSATAPGRARPVLLAPPAAASAMPAPVCFTYRDREEELLAVAARLKQQRRDGTASPLHRTALVVRRPLPYLYLAREVFRDAGVPFEALDTLPLAAEPYAAAVDLVLDAVAGDFTRASLMALLRSPHFRVWSAPRPPDFPADASSMAPLAACDVALAGARFLGGLDRLARLVDAWSATDSPANRDERRRQAALPALGAVLAAARALQPLAETRSMVAQIETLVEWLKAFDRPAEGDGAVESRRRRVQAAVLGALVALRQAYADHDPGAEGDVVVLTAAIRRWLGAQTFAVESGEPGLQIVDAQAARYGDFDDLQLVGLIDGEWPERQRRNVLYPSSLLALLEPAPGPGDPSARERQALQSAKAAFRELLVAPAGRLTLSTVLLEHDAVVEPSLLLDEVAPIGLQAIRGEPAPARTTWSDAIALEPRRPDVLPEPLAAWARTRIVAGSGARQRDSGEAGPWRLPRVSVSRLELFLNCPFKFFASHVLRLEEEPEDRAIQTPLERGLFLHDLWERFFAEWQRRGYRRIDQDHLEEATRLFAEICEVALEQLSPVEAALERHKLLGSALSPGIAHRVFAMEACRGAAIVERLLEFPLEGEFELRAKDGRVQRVPINAKTDRIDVLEGQRLRVIDYKSKTTPDPKAALQLPIYAHLARQVLRAKTGGECSLDEALYVSFEGDRPIVPLRPGRDETLDTLIADAQDRLLDALERIAGGHFPVRPLKKSMCGPCSYRAVCRLEWQALEAAEGRPAESGDAGDGGGPGEARG